MKASLFAAAMATAITASAYAAGPYAITNLGNLGESPIFALDVNNNRQASGNSTINGTTQAFLITVPEPASITLLGLSGLLGLRRRRMSCSA